MKCAEETYTMLHRILLGFIAAGSLGPIACGDGTMHDGVASVEVPEFAHVEAPTDFPAASATDPASAAPTDTPAQIPQATPEHAGVPPGVGVLLSRAQDAHDRVEPLRCTAVVVAPNEVIAPAHCFDWFRDGVNVTGVHTFEASDGERARVIHVAMHPRYPLISCNVNGPLKYWTKCLEARRRCVTLHRSDVARLLQCQRNVEVRVRELLNEAAYDIARVRLAMPLRVAPVRLSSTLPDLGETLWYVNNQDDAWHTTHVVTVTAPDFTAARCTLTDPMPLAFVRAPDGWALTGLASRVERYFEHPQPGVSEMHYTSVAEHRGWLSQPVTSQPRE